MNKQTLLRATVATLLGLAVIAGGGKSYAADADDVKASIDGFHAALSGLDLAKMDAVWSHDASVMDKEPLAKDVSLGWEAARKNFEGLFGAMAELKVTQAEGPHIQVQGDVAWAIGTANAAQKLKTGKAFNVTVLEADVFKKLDGHWLYVSHATSIMGPPPQ